MCWWSMGVGVCSPSAVFTCSVSWACSVLQCGAAVSPQGKLGFAQVAVVSFLFNHQPARGRACSKTPLTLGPNTSLNTPLMLRVIFCPKTQDTGKSELKPVSHTGIPRQWIRCNKIPWWAALLVVTWETALALIWWESRRKKPVGDKQTGGGGKNDVMSDALAWCDVSGSFRLAPGIRGVPLGRTLVQLIVLCDPLIIMEADQRLIGPLLDGLLCQWSSSESIRWTMRWITWPLWSLILSLPLISLTNNQCFFTSVPVNFDRLVLYTNFCFPLKTTIWT